MTWTLDANAEESQGSGDVSTIFAAASAEYPLNRFLSLFGSIGRMIRRRFAYSDLNESLDGVLAVSFNRQFADEPSDEFIEAIASVG